MCVAADAPDATPDASTSSLVCDDPVATSDTSTASSRCFHSLVCVTADAPDATSDASSSSLVCDIAFAPVATSDASTTSSTCFHSLVCVTSDMACPDFNPVFDAFDEMDAVLAKLCFKVAIDFTPILQTIGVPIQVGGNSHVASHETIAVSLPSSPSPLTSLSVPNELPSSSDCQHNRFTAYSIHMPVTKPEFISLPDCCRVYDLLAKFVGCYLLFEVECLDELFDLQSDINAGVVWNPGFIISCLLEFEMFFKHFSDSHSPRIIEFFPDCGQFVGREE